MGGGNPASSEQTTDLPDWAKPYYERALGRVEASSLTPYQQYSGDRLANAADYGNITKAQGIVSNLGGVPGLGAAQDYSQYAMDQSKALGNYTPTQATAAQFSPYAGYQAGSAAPYSGFQAGAADPYSGFKAGTANPYSDFTAGSIHKQNLILTLILNQVLLIHIVILKKHSLTNITTILRDSSLGKKSRTI
jgi:hypothetical protein